MGMRATMVTMSMRKRMRQKMHRKAMTDERRRKRTEGIVGDVNRCECEHGDDPDADEEE
jgi:hypothetical protein